MTLRILMVDDEVDAKDLFLQNFRREIRKRELEFLFAESGETALSVLSSGRERGIRIILSDINMPGMKGTELLDRVKRNWPELPVIMISAYGDPGTEAKAVALGAERLIPKPVDFQYLKRELLAFAQNDR